MILPTITLPKCQCAGRSRDPDHAPLGVIHVPLRSTRRDLYNKEKTKCLALPVQKLRRGSQNLKSRSRDRDHAPF